MTRSRHILVAIAQSPTHEPGARRLDECMGSELRCRSGGAEFVGLGVFVSQLGCALIGSSSPVSRRSSSRNYTSFSPFCFVWLRFSLLVLARLCY